MDLDNVKGIRGLDGSDYYSQIIGLPMQLREGWGIGKSCGLSVSKDKIQQVFVCGMGGSAIGADLAASYCRDKAKKPIIINREYDLPGWVMGEESLVVASSHSGNTEETLSCFQQALERDCSILAVSTGGELEKLAAWAGVNFWKFQHAGQPRAAVGFSLGLMLAAFYEAGVIADPEAEIRASVDFLERESAQYTLETPIPQNGAKRLAGQMVGRIPVIFGSDALAPVARRCKTQVNELAKAWAQFEFLPEADHNTAAGIAEPLSALSNLFALFLVSDSDHPRNRLRSEMTRRNLLLEGIACDEFTVPGQSLLEKMLAGVQFCDFVSFYLAAAYGLDPTPIPGIVAIKESLAGGNS